LIARALRRRSCPGREHELSRAGVPTPASAPLRLRLEGLAHRGQRGLLAVEVGAIGERRQHQHRARRAARDPDAAVALRRLRRRQRLDDAHGLAGRVARRIGLISEPAGVPSSDSVSAIAARRPSTSKRAASTAGLSA
jgi:hypothetical protein